MRAPRIAYFGHDARDAAFRRRAESLVGAGAALTTFTMRRGPPTDLPWPNVDLGETKDAAFGQRMRVMARALAPTLRARAMIRDADAIVARNLDAALVAAAARALTRSKARLVYEALDVHRLLLREDAVGAAMRAAEGLVLRRASLLVTSSPAFVTGNFRAWHTRVPPIFLLENRLPVSERLAARPRRGPRPPGPPRVGWFGMLRCRMSLALLIAAADALGPRLQIVIRGVLRRRCSKTSRRRSRGARTCGSRGAIGPRTILANSMAPST